MSTQFELEPIPYRVCSIEDCDRKHVSNDYCKMHYNRYWRYGDPHKKLRDPAIHDGRGKHPLHETYHGIKARCYNKNHKYYARYGGRGIVMCEEWRNNIDGFLNFIRDMGEKPTPKHSIDRIDNDGNYEPNNCRWATHYQQASNTHITSGRVTGVYETPHNTWASRIKVRGKMCTIGTFKTQLEAINARTEYRKVNNLL